MSNAPMTCGRDDGGEPSSPSPRSKVPQPDDRRDGVPAPRRRLTGEKVAEIQRLRPHMERLILGKGMGRVREDLLQEAVLRLVRRWSDPEFEIDRGDGGRAFATTVTLGVIADACRAYDRDRSFPSDTLPESAHTDPETDEYLRIRAVESVLEKALPEKGGLREVAHLWIVVGLGQTEIGRALRIDRKTVKRRTDRIRAHLAPPTGRPSTTSSDSVTSALLGITGRTGLPATAARDPRLGPSGRTEHAGGRPERSGPGTRSQIEEVEVSTCQTSAVFSTDRWRGVRTGCWSSTGR